LGTQGGETKGIQHVPNGKKKNANDSKEDQVYTERPFQIRENEGEKKKKNRDEQGKKRQQQK